MRHPILAVACAGIMGCTTTTVHQDGDEISVIVETPSLFSDVSALTDAAKAAACPGMMTFELSGESSAARAWSVLPTTLTTASMGSLTNVINAVNKLHESVKGWFGRTTVKLRGTCQ